MTAETTNPSASPLPARKKLIIVNGSPRETGNTATLLRHAQDGAREAGADTEWVTLYDLDFRGCRSCFACKLRGGKSYGRCAQRDGLSPTLATLEQADALLIGSPIYLGAMSGATRSFVERVLFPWFTYTLPPRSLFPKRLAVGAIYTMNKSEAEAAEAGYWTHLGQVETGLQVVFGAPVHRVPSFDTLQFDDYARFEADRFDPENKQTRHREAFPQDCSAARELGKALVR